MRRVYASALIASMLALPSFAFAQTATTGTANATNSVTVVAAGNMPAGSSGATDGTSRMVESGHLYGTPSVQGSYFAGANPCLIGVGASGAGGPIGLSFTFGRNDEGCTRRSDAAAFHALGLDNVAVSRMCQDQESADAFFGAVGAVCPGVKDRERYKLADGALAPYATLAGLHYSQVATPATAAYVPTLPNASIALQPTPAQVATSLPNDAGFNTPGWCSSVTGAAEHAKYKVACKF